MPRTLLAALALAALAAPITAAPAQQRQSVPGARETEGTFDWSGQIPAGSWLRIRNLNGSIDVRAGSGADAQVHAEKRWRRGDPRDVHFALARNGNDVTICALWNETDTCDEGGYHSHGHHDHDDDNDVSVRFTVTLPAGVKIDAATVNGGVDVSGARAEVIARSVNGRVDAATARGPVDARTVNGSIHVRMDAVPSDADLSYETVNGSVVVEVPAAFNADLEMETVNGGLTTDFPVTIANGRLTPRHLRARIGNGGGRLALKTVNGSVELRKLP